MAKSSKVQPDSAVEQTRAVRLARLTGPARVAGVDGPGHWLLAEYEPTALFSLKLSQATSSVGKTLVVPTPYAIKMALVDAAFRAGLLDAECEDFFGSLVGLDVRIAPPAAATVTHTFVKVRQESRKGDPLRPYDSTIAYREIVYHHGRLLWAFDLAGCDDTAAERLVRLAPHVSYVGKRGSFIQFVGFSRTAELSDRFTQPVQNELPWSPPPRAHVVILDDFGPEADLETLSSFTDRSPKRDRHRKFVETIVPVGLVNTGPGFSEYRAD
jgi:hypothetical protein